jgi:hypothetical protein
MTTQLPDLNTVKPSAKFPGRAPDGDYEVIIRKAYPHTGGQTNDLLAVLEYDIVTIHSQTTTVGAFYEGGVKKERSVPTVLVGDRRAMTCNFKNKAAQSEWRSMLEFLAAHPEVKEDVTDWKKFNNDVMGPECMIDGLKARLRVSTMTAKTTGNSFPKYDWSYVSQ